MKQYNKASHYHSLYDKANWHKIRAAQLRDNPLCAYCINQGLTTLATICDHIKPHKGNINLFTDRNNLQSLCKLCHDKTKAQIERKGFASGCNIDGIPLYKNKHWQ